MGKLLLQPLRAVQWYGTRVLIVFTVLILVEYSSPSPGCTADILSGDNVDFRLLVNDRFQIFNNFYDQGSKGFSSDKNFHIMYVNPYVSTMFGPYLRGVLELESEFLLDLDSRHTDESTEVRNAYIQCLAPWWNWISFTLGRQALRTIDGLIYDDEAPALKAYADLERGFDVPIRVQTFIAYVRQESPYAHLELKYSFSFLEYVSFCYGRYHDKHNGIARIFNRLRGEKVFESAARINWYAVSFQKFLWKVLLKTTFIYENGTIHLQHKTEGNKKIGASAYLVNCTLDYNFTEKSIGSLFCYLSSGDNQPERGTFSSFVSIDPYIDKTNIFFNGGIDYEYSSNRVGLNGIQLNGVIAPGMSLNYQPQKKLTMKLVYAYLLTHRSTGGKGNTYGWETDFSVYYDINSAWQLVFEFNLFSPGDYFKHLTDNNTHKATETIIGVTYHF